MPKLALIKHPETRGIYFLIDENVIFNDEFIPFKNKNSFLLDKSTSKTIKELDSEVMIYIQEHESSKGSLMPKQDILKQRGWRDLSKTIPGSCFSATREAPFFTFSSNSMTETLAELEWLGNMVHLDGHQGCLGVVEYIRKEKITNPEVRKVIMSQDAFLKKARALYVPEAKQKEEEAQQENFRLYQQFITTQVLSKTADRVLLLLKRKEKLSYSEEVWTQLYGQLMQEMQDLPTVLTIESGKIKEISMHTPAEEITEIINNLAESLTEEIKLHITETGSVENDILHNAAILWVRQRNKGAEEKARQLGLEAAMKQHSLFRQSNAADPSANSSSVGERIATAAAKSAAKEATAQVFRAVL